MFDFWKKNRVGSISRLSVRYPTSFPYQLRAIITSAENRSYDSVKDLSETGVGIATIVPLPADKLVVVKFDSLHFPVSLTPFEVRGKVVWSRENSMGVQFEEYDMRILDLVNSLSKP